MAENFNSYSLDQTFVNNITDGGFKIICNVVRTITLRRAIQNVEIQIKV